MSFVSSWATPDHRVLLSLPKTVLTVFEKHIQENDGDREAGGLLIGTVHGSNIALVEATEPTLFDKRLRYFFERMPFGHSTIAEARWRESRGTVRYLGEWHTHPQDYPSPSGVDRTEWSQLSRQRLDKRPMLAVIVGRKGLYIELVPCIGVGPILLPISD